MKEVKKSLGNFKTMQELETFLEEDNERPYKQAGYRRKLGINVIRNAFVEEFNSTVWLFSRGYGIEYYFTEEELRERIG